MAMGGGGFNELLLGRITFGINRGTQFGKRDKLWIKLFGQTSAVGTNSSILRGTKFGGGQNLVKIREQTLAE